MIPQIETHLHFISILAESQLDRRLRSKLDASDLVQETMSRASLSFAQLREPNNELVVRAWLQRILANVIADERKKFGADKRNVALERTIAAELAQSASGLEGWLVADQTSPSMAAARNEEIAWLARALSALPVDLREVVLLKHIKNVPLKDIAAETGRSHAAVAGMLRRGLAKLREQGP